MTTLLFGDPDENPALIGNKKGKNQTLLGTDNDSINLIFGDVGFMYVSSKGGNDTLQGGNNLSGMLINGLIGDAAFLFDSAKGGNDTLQGGHNRSGMLINGLAGDAAVMFDSARGGNDTLQGGNNKSGVLINGLVGDAAGMVGFAKGGNDTLHGGNNNNGTLTNVLAGDALVLLNDSEGGNDTLWGGNNNGAGIVINHLYGDARSISDSTQLGNDRLISGSNATDHMYGDAKNLISGNIDILGDIFELIENLVPTTMLFAGVDTFDFMNALKSASLDDLHQLPLGKIESTNPISIGNKLKNILDNNENLTFNKVVSGGADTFVFNDNFGDDYIYDFRQLEGDNIEIGIAGVNSLDDLVIEDNGNDTIIAVDGHGTITLIGVSGIDLSGNVSFVS